MKIEFNKFYFIFYAISFLLLALAIYTKNLSFGLMGILIAVIGFCIDLFMRYKEIHKEVTEIKFRIKNGEENESKQKTN